MWKVFDLDLYYNIDNELILDFYTKSLHLVRDRLNDTFDQAKKKCKLSDFIRFSNQYLPHE